MYHQHLALRRAACQLGACAGLTCEQWEYFDDCVPHAPPAAPERPVPGPTPQMPVPPVPAVTPTPVTPTPVTPGPIVPPTLTPNTRLPQLHRYERPEMRLREPPPRLQAPRRGTIDPRFSVQFEPWQRFRTVR